MSDFLDRLTRDAIETVNQGYYQVSAQAKHQPLSLRKAIVESRGNAVIAEVKAASPSKGTIRERLDPSKVAEQMEKGGAAAISVLTEPKHFKGSLTYLAEVRKTVKLPILMKDIIVHPEQLEAAPKLGADTVLLIQALFDRKHCEYSLDEMIAKAHDRRLEVLLETHNKKEFQTALSTEADLIGINNRDLRTLEVDTRTTEAILKEFDASERVIVSESGVMTPRDVLFLRKCGAQAFLIGSAIMMAENIQEKVKEFVNAGENR